LQGGEKIATLRLLYLAREIPGYAKVSLLINRIPKPSHPIRSITQLNAKLIEY
jgi:hypothetical protein